MLGTYALHALGHSKPRDNDKGFKKVLSALPNHSIIYFVTNNTATMPPQLSGDDIDDLLYFARIGDQQEYDNLTAELCKREHTTAISLLHAARDPFSSNGPMHMVAANGHTGIELSTSHSRKLREGPMLTSAPRRAQASSRQSSSPSGAHHRPRTRQRHGAQS